MTSAILSPKGPENALAAASPTAKLDQNRTTSITSTQTSGPLADAGKMVKSVSGELAPGWKDVPGRVSEFVQHPAEAAKDVLVGRFGEASTTLKSATASGANAATTLTNLGKLLRRPSFSKLKTLTSSVLSTTSSLSDTVIHAHNIVANPLKLPVSPTPTGLAATAARDLTDLAQKSLQPGGLCANLGLSDTGRPIEQIASRIINTAICRR